MSHQLFAVGDFGRQDEYNPGTLIRQQDAWPLLEQLRTQPLPAPMLAERSQRPVAEVVAVLIRLSALGIVHADGDRWRLGFAWFTGADLEAIGRAVQPAASTLAARLLDHRYEIDRRIAQLRSAAWIDADTLRFALVGCVGLDWGGLKRLKESRYLVHHKPQPGARRYVMYVQDTRQGLNKDYAGSHSSHISERYAWTSFGDHSGSRFGLPDMLWPVVGALMKANLLAPARQHLKESLIMEGLVSYLQVAAEALEWAAAGMKPAGLGRTVLEAAGGLDGDRPAVPVFFGDEDGPAIDAIDELVRETVLTVVSEQYEALQRSLGGISPLIHQVDFAECFNCIYHELFGQTNRILAEQGYLADPEPGTPGEGRYRWWLTINPRWSA